MIHARVEAEKNIKSVVESKKENFRKRRDGQPPVCVFFYIRAIKQRETNTVERGRGL